MNAPVRPPPEPTEHRFTYEEFVRLGEACAFGEGRRFELRDGRLIEMPSEGALHMFVRHKMLEDFASQLPAIKSMGLTFLTDPTVRISDKHVVIPDFVFGRPPRSDAPYGPQDLLLAIEVAVSTVSYDRKVKREDYAAAGFADYWLVEPEAKLVRVFTAPDAGDYAEVSVRRPGERLALPFAPQISWDIAAWV